MFALAFFAFCAADPLNLSRPLNFDTVSIERAKTFEGKPTAITFLVQKPLYTWRGRTIIGAADRDDGAERTAVLGGHRYDIEEGSRITLIGTVQVIRHPTAFVNSVVVQEWDEIRVVVP